MSRHRRVRAAALAAVVLAAVPAVGAGTLARRELGLALAESRGAGEGAAEQGSARLRAALVALRAENARMRQRFDRDASHRLPEPAAARLAAAREAHERGQGRLAELIERALASRNAEDRRALLDEARALHAQVEEAALAQPVSAAPRVRPAALVPPALPIGSGSEAVSAPEAAVGPVSQALRDAAAGLAGPIEVFEWVRNELRAEFYHGQMKGALAAFAERAGNDADTAAVLVEMLRAKGVPARYVRGVAEVPAASLVSITGTADVSRALRVLERAGIPHEAVTGPGGVTAVRMDRVWVEAYVPYANYRGAVIDAEGSVWIRLDAAYKATSAAVGLDVVEALGFDARQVQDDYIAASQAGTPLESIRANVTALLAAQLPGTSYEDVLDRRVLEPQRLGLLPSTLPYKVVSVAGVSYDVDESLRHRVRFIGEDGDGSLFDVALDAAEVQGRRVTLAYEPETEEDRQVIASYGGLPRTPPYLVRLRPVVKVGGIAVGTASRGIGMGIRYELRIETTSPGGTEAITNRVQAGNLVAIGFSGRTAGASSDGSADGMLATVAARYLQRWDASDEELATLLRVVPVRPTLSACLVFSDVEVEYAGGDPHYPLTFDWKGVLVDADLRPSSPAGRESDAAEARFLMLSGLEGSVLEERVLSQDLRIPSVSTASVLGLAAAQGLTVHALTRENVDDILPTLPFDAAVLEEIRDAALQGLLVRVPSGFVTRQAWQGVGYALLDEETGASAWQLQGGHSGGVTTPAVIEIPAAIRDPLIEQGQGIEPAPADAVVRHILKFVSTDFQDGTVGTQLAKPLRVLVTDEEGRAVAGANVTFSVLGGGSGLINPAIGGLGDLTVTVRSNDRGEAEVAQILGTRTDVIPRLLILPDPQLNPVQVGLNLVTARAGSAALDEPFSTFALPDYRPTPDGHVLGIFEWMSLSPLGPWPQLSVASRMALSVRDQHGNPLSNFLVRFTPRPPPFTQPPPPHGAVLIRPPTSTPARVLGPKDYLTCLAQHPSPHYGDCAGETGSLLTGSTHLGVFSYAVLGDSPWSVYTFDVATTLEPVGWASLQTPAWMCTHLGQCQGSEAPSPPLVATGLRPVRVNRLGNVVEAAPAGGGGPFSLWADALSEIERVERVVDGNGVEHLMAVGTNSWRRERLLDSEVRLTPRTPGTAVTPPTAAPVGDGTYRTTIVTALDPQRNEVEFEAKHFPLRLVYLPDRWPELDPAHVDPFTLRAERIRIADQPIQTSGGYGLWGISPRLVDLDPSPVKVTPEGVVSQPSIVSAQIRPEAYRALLAPQDVLFEVVREGQPVLAANGVPGSYEVPVGLPFPENAHEARLSVLSVATGPAGYESVMSPPLDLPRCSLLDLHTPFVSIPMAVDFVNATSCAQEGLLKFELCEAARVTLRVEGQVYEGDLRIPSDPSFSQFVRFEDLELPAGKYTIAFRPEYLGPNVLASKAFILSATSVLEADQTAEAPGTIANSARNRAVLSVGRTFVKGVDLLDGHAVRSHADVEIPGRHLGLTVQRTYSSAGADRSGLLGAGWAFSYESRLFITDCGVIVQTAEGGSQVFSGEGPTYVPQRGYHTRLVLNPDNTFDFFDKAGNRHHFDAPEFLGIPDNERRLLFIEEPHGDRIALDYDSKERLARVSEVHPESSTPVRQLEMRYVKKGGFDRIASIQAVGLGIEVQYSYDEWGNLKEVRRDGPPLWRERYQYSVVNIKDRHQLLEVIDANDHVTRYEYYAASDVFPGQAGAPIRVDNEEYVRRVVESPGGGAGPVAIQFTYDLSDVLSLRWQTTVRDGNGVDARYVLNGNGGDLERIEAVGTSRERRTTSEWSETDIFKTSTTDAAGRVTRFGHDGQGNLTSERVETADLGVVERRWLYGPFNRLVSETDAAGRTTTWDVDPANGDVRSRTDAAGNETRFEYLDHGLIESETDPRGNVATHSNHDSFGNARTISGPEGRTVTRVFDTRGRLRNESDSLGHEVEQDWDGLDRLVRRRRLAGNEGDAAADEELQWEYYPGGQKRAEIGPLQARTEFTIDGLDRVTREQVQVDGELLAVERSYDANGNVIKEKDRRGVQRTFSYDALNRLLETRIASGPAAGPIGAVARQDYDAVDRKLFEVDLAGLRTDYEYDGLYRVRRKLLPETCATGRCFEEYGYDLVGNRTLSRDIDGRAEVAAYDGLNRVTSKTDRANRTWTTVYDDPEGSHVNKSEDRDPFGLVTSYRYDGLNRETEQRQALNGGGSEGEIYTVSTDYDDAAHAVVVTDPRGRRTRSQLDGLDRTTRSVADVDGLALESLSTWNGASKLLSLRDPEGHFTRNTYDILGRLREVEDALEGRAHYEYDRGGLKVGETDRRGVRSTMTYDNLARPLRTEVEPSLTSVAWSESKAYLDHERRQVLTDARGKQTTVHFDGLGRVVRTTDPDGHETVTEWLGLSDRRERDKRGQVRELRFDGVGRPVLVRDPAPYETQTVTTSYDDAGNRTTETDRRGIVRVTQKDSLQRLRSMTRAGIEQERHAYDGNGNRVASFDPAGRETRFEYDGANRLLGRTDGFGTPQLEVTTFENDRDGNVTLERDARTAELGQPFSVRRTYDALHRLETVTDAESHVTTNGYDAEGHKTSVTEPGQQVTTFAYGEKGELTLVRQPAGTTHAPPETRVAYDPARNPLAQTDGNGHRVEMTWDDLGRQDLRTQKDAPEGDLVTDPSYDPNGNMIRLVDAKGQIVTQTYDQLDRLKTKTWAFAPGDPYRPWRYTTSMTYTWDPNGNLLRVEEIVASGTDPPVTLSTIRTYDDLDRLTSEEETLPEGGSATVHFTYYPDGLRETVTDHAGRVTRYTYDGRGRLETQTQDFGTPAAAVTTYAYWPDSLLRTVRSPNGVVAHHDYDGADRLTALVNEKDGVPVSSYSYTYDANGNRRTQVETTGGAAETTTYTYDDLNRLETVTYPPDATHESGRRVAYTYDSVGNRIDETTTDLGSQAVVGHLAGSFDAVNRLTSLADLADPSRTTTFAWDRNGNQVAKTVGSGEPETYRYDVGDRPVEVSRGAGVLSRFQYDFDGRRRLKIGEDDIRQYVHDGTSLLTELDASPIPIEKARYSYGSDRLISLTRSDEGTRFYHFDGLGSVTALTDPVGASVASYHLDAWGVFRNQGELDASRNRFAFTGYQFDRETELYFAKARLYDPTVGRFTSQDSFLGQIDKPPSLHRYFYAHNRPTFWTDPTGHAPGDWWDARSYLGNNAYASGFRSGLTAGYFENAADIGDSIAAFGKGVGGTGAGLVTGSAQMSAKVLQLDYKLRYGWLEEKRAAVREGAGIARGAASHLKQSAQLLAHGVANPGDVADAAVELGIEGVSNVLGGATLEAALLIAPVAKGSSAAVVIQEGRQGTSAMAVASSAELPEAGAILATRGASGRTVADFMRAARERMAATAAEYPEVGIRSQLRSGARAPSTGTTLEIPVPARLRNPSILAAERAMLERELRVKLRPLQRAARAGELEYRPGTMEARIADLQAQYRADVAGRYSRRFGVEPDMRLLDADHPLDLVVRGSPTQRLKMLHRSINRSVGSSLKQAAERLGLEPGDLIADIVVQHP